MIDAHTQLFAVFGHPVAHSLSPAIHNRAFDLLGINAVYVACDVEDIHSAVAGVRALGVRGVSVTIPHKIAVMEDLDDIDPLARRVGAVNTIVNRDGCLTGYNTDCDGAIQALETCTTVRSKRVAVLGAGGAARAVAFGVQAAGGIPLLFNRTLEKCQALAAEVGCEGHALADFDGAHVDIVVNTTPVGMHPETAATPLAQNTLHPGLTVMDIIYNPLETRLMAEAQARGCRTLNGVEMFVFQGARQLQLWTAQTPPVDAMRQMVLSHLNQE